MDTGMVVLLELSFLPSGVLVFPDRPGRCCLCSVLSSAVLVARSGHAAERSIFQCSCEDRNPFLSEVNLVIEVIDIEGWVVSQVYVGSESTIS